MKTIIFFLFLIGFLFIFTPFVRAQVCYPQRVINQHRCVGSAQDCTLYQSEDVGTICHGNSTVSDIKAVSDCKAKCEGVYPGQGCAPGYCMNYASMSTCRVESFYAGCTAAPSCQTTSNVVSCAVDVANTACTETTQTLTYGCWGAAPTPTPAGPTPTPIPSCGNGSCEAGLGESCSTCSSDCGACPPPGLCGNGSCDIGETCSSCAGDCGACPTPTPTPTPPSGTVKARIVGVSRADTSCAAVLSSTNYLDGTSFTITGQPSQTQAAGGYVSWTVPVNSYTLAAIPPINWSVARGCWNRTVTAPASGEGLAATLGGSGETLTWDIGAVPPGPWVQTQGGDVYAAMNLSSLLPVGIVPRKFNLNGTGGYPGVVTYGTSYDFDPDSSSQGQALVSSTNWLVNETQAQVDYYQIFYRRLGAPTTPDSFPNLAAVTKPASRTTPYYVVGDMTTSGDWSVGAGENITFLVNGNLTIGGKINITGTGFVAFIVNGNITVLSSVGGAVGSGNPAIAIEGFYVTSPTGTFATGTSGVGTEQLVGKGTFVAGNFVLQRDLGDASNVTTPAELFIYNPQLLIVMPEAMKDVPVAWQEVAP